VFSRLKQALGRVDGAMQLKADPTSLAPDRVIVFEVAGRVDDFAKAVARVPGLEMLGETETDFAADEDFSVIDDRKGREGQDRLDKAISGRFYLTSPDTAALNQLLGLWDQWQATGKLDTGFAPFGQLFLRLHKLRPWGPIDRISDETIAFWTEEAARNPGRSVRMEVELWYYPSEARRTKASTEFAALVREIGGDVRHEAVIPEIAYHGILIDVPAGEVENLVTRRPVKLAIFDDVMFLRPQSHLVGPGDAEPFENPAFQIPAAPAAADAAIAALLDGVPVALHAWLRDRIILDDPDDLQRQTTVDRRIHGTAMASLILHGDLNAGEPPLTRPLYVRPLLQASAGGLEQSDSNRLLTDTVHRAILRMRGAGGEEPAAPSVFIVNLSIGDPRRPFTQSVSPLARLLDYLAFKYGILFIVSAGNSDIPLDIPAYDDWGSFVAADPRDREKAVLAGLNSSKHERSILSPAESLNALTIGAQHHDNVVDRPAAAHATDPFDDMLLPNVSSAMGLGYRRAVKPDIYLPGGREYVRMKRSGGGLQVSVGRPQRLYGLSAAAADVSGQGRENQLALSDGTSSATALATRAAHRIFDSLMDPDGSTILQDMDPAYYAVVVKALLVHRAKWNSNADILKEICGPQNRKQFDERSDNVSRFLGFGVPNIAETIECAPNRATLVGFGSLGPEKAVVYNLPLPRSLERVTEPRAVTLTIGWLSPIKPGHQSYRCTRFEAAPLLPVEAFGIGRTPNQPADRPVKRGSIFHEHFYGAKAVPFINDGHLSFKLWRKEDAGGINDDIRYGIAISVEAEGAIPVYEEIQQRLRVAPRP
jgi:hypothetical protein